MSSCHASGGCAAFENFFPSLLAAWLNSSVKVSVNDVIGQALTCLTFEEVFSSFF